jgi:hypothetical protein
MGPNAAGRISSIEKFSDLTKDWNPRPSGLERSASTDYATVCPSCSADLRPI